MTKKRLSEIFGVKMGIFSKSPPMAFRSQSVSQSGSQSVSLDDYIYIHRCLR